MLTFESSKAVRFRGKTRTTWGGGVVGVTRRSVQGVLSRRFGSQIDRQRKSSVAATLERELQATTGVQVYEVARVGISEL